MMTTPAQKPKFLASRCGGSMIKKPCRLKQSFSQPASRGNKKLSIEFYQENQPKAATKPPCVEAEPRCQHWREENFHNNRGGAKQDQVNANHDFLENGRLACEHACVRLQRKITRDRYIKSTNDNKAPAAMIRQPAKMLNLGQKTSRQWSQSRETHTLSKTKNLPK